MPKKKVVPMRPTAGAQKAPYKAKWSSDLKGELAKLRALMQQKFSEIGEFDPNVKLVHALDYGGNKNQFILCREVDGVLNFFTDPEEIMEKTEPLNEGQKMEMETKVSEAAQKAIQEQLEKTLAMNSRRIKKMKVTH